MKSNFEPAMVIGSCILIGSGVIGLVMASPRDFGPILAALSIFFGTGFLYKFWKPSNED
jgi:hypothetical protein